ncbi:MAG TPA: hypothetical protein VGG99_06625 [Acetobacteraceae bacterium]|jgi:hypothetical protein
MLASAIARWIVAVQLAASAFVGAFMLAIRASQLLHVSHPATIGAAGGAGTIAAALVGMLIVPVSNRSAARYVFGGIPIVCGLLALVGCLASHTFTMATGAGMQALVLAGFAVVWTSRGTSTAPA